MQKSKKSAPLRLKIVPAKKHPKSIKNHVGQKFPPNESRVKVRLQGKNYSDFYRSRRGVSRQINHSKRKKGSACPKVRFMKNGHFLVKKSQIPPPKCHHRRSTIRGRFYRFLTELGEDYPDTFEISKNGSKIRNFRKNGHFSKNIPPPKKT